MTQEHSIAPPPELVKKWVDQSTLATDRYQCIATRAAQWGADQELEACCKWLAKQGWFSADEHEAIEELRASRRPKPPNLKEQALEAVKQIPVEPDGGPWRTAMETIIHALHQLPDQN